MFDDLYLYLCAAEIPCYDGEGDDGDNGDVSNVSNVSNGDEGDKGDKGVEGGGDDRSFSQDDVNRIVEERLARDRKKNEEKYIDLEGRYSTLLDNKNLSEEERGKLEEDLEDIRKRLRTKEEEAKHQMKQTQEQYESQLTEARAAVKVWEDRFHESSIQRALQDAAVANDAYNPSQVINLLKPLTKLKPMVDETTGKEMDGFETVIDFTDRDDKGNTVMTQRTPDETVKRMKELSDYANLFKSNVVSGVGANSATGGISPGINGRVDVRNLTPEQYRKIRKENPELLGLRH